MSGTSLKRKFGEIDEDADDVLPIDQINTDVEGNSQYCQHSENVDVNNSTPAKKTSSIKKNITIRPLGMICEWNMCTRVYDKVESFMMHLSGHIEAMLESGIQDDYPCSWRECEGVCKDKEEMIRHIYYHGFHSKLKSIGSQYMSIYNLECQLERYGRNLIPEIPENFQCMWDTCSDLYYSAQAFYWHLQTHILEADEETDGKWCCKWRGCKLKYKSRCRLKDHSRSHTQEKVTSCPNCGSIFSSNTKFNDHIEKQLPTEEQNYQCSHCSRKYATERLLRDHVRHHINRFKCPLCDMTCPHKSALETHINYRHRKKRIHECLDCSKRFKSANDLGRHILTHSEENPYVCAYVDCSYSARTVSTYNRHILQKHHGIKIKSHACHICDARYTEGGALSRHFIKVHNFRWPPGHVRFKYKKDQDGLCRLQTVRYESLELNQELSGGTAEEEGIEEAPQPQVDAPDAENNENKVKQEQSNTMRKEQLTFGSLLL